MSSDLLIVEELILPFHVLLHVGLSEFIAREIEVAANEVWKPLLAVHVDVAPHQCEAGDEDCEERQKEDREGSGFLFDSFFHKANLTL